MQTLIINDYVVDISRCQVQRGHVTVSLEPKVIEVLQLLAQHQGEVVSQKQLLETVWANRVVEPATIQRCIAQLRKALGDSAKQQNIIVTYPKKGYSLVPQVNWSSSDPGERRDSSTRYWAWSLVASLTLGAALLVLMNSDELTENVNQDGVPATIVSISEGIPIETQLQAPSLTDATDFFAVYSQDGNYLVYPRFLDNGLSQLWVSDINSEDEYLLTPEADDYLYATWSPDNSSIAYVYNSCADLSEEQAIECEGQDCNNLTVISLPSGQSEAQPSQNMYAGCHIGKLSYPQWIESEQLVLIEESEGNSTIVMYNPKTQIKRILYQERGVTPYYLSYSPKAEMLAIALKSGTEAQNLMVFSMQNDSINVLYTENGESQSLTPWYPLWNQSADGLIINSSDGVLEIDLSGNISKQSFPFMTGQADRS